MKKFIHIDYKHLWRDVIESIRGTEMDFTKGSLKRAIFLLSVPMVLETLMESVFAVVDIFYVSKLGHDAVATVGITESVMTLVYAVSIGFSAATTAIVSRRIGEKNYDKASLSSIQAIITGITISLFIAIPGILYAVKILELMGLPQSLIEKNFMYTSIMMGGNIVIMLLFIINAVFRSAGDAAISMRVLWFANIINIVLDPCLIFGWGPFPEMGIAGAAVATNIGRGLAVLYQFYLLFNGKNRIKVRLQHVKVNIKIIKSLFNLSFGGIGQHLIATSSWIFLMRIVSDFGSVVVAGYTIALRIVFFAMMPSWGLSNAASTLVGQNLGAKHPMRAEKSVRITSIANMIFLGIIGIILVAFPEPFIRFFISDSDVIEKGITGLRIISYGFVFYALGMVMVQSFNGAGDTKTPTWINLFCYWLIEIPLAYLLSKSLGMKENGVYYAVIISESLMAMAGYFLFLKGKWKKKMV